MMATVEGRWTLHVCKDCGQRSHWQDRCPKDRRRVWTEQVPVPVVPVDDAAIERLAQHLYDTDESRVRPEDGPDWTREPDGYKGLYRDRAREACRVLAAESYS
jgi:hypothetical protein